MVFFIGYPLFESLVHLLVISRPDKTITNLLSILFADAGDEFSDLFINSLVIFKRVASDLFENQIKNQWFYDLFLIRLSPDLPLDRLFSFI